ncbi:hypothetical protein [Nocardia sp. NPDC046763]|uniref:hypothetical protein n=1 Tax=Nocardia sp. NPDC046763 TaxID=3155256 RepID=UPI00340FB21F
MADADLRSLPPGLAPLWRELHRRLSSGQTVSRLRVRPLDEPERIAIAEFFGMPRLPGGFAMVAMDTFEKVLFAATGSTVRAAVGRIVDPIGDRGVERLRAAMERIGIDDVRSRLRSVGWLESLEDDWTWI